MQMADIVLQGRRSRIIERNFIILYFLHMFINLSYDMSN